MAMYLTANESVFRLFSFYDLYICESIYFLVYDTNASLNRLQLF